MSYEALQVADVYIHTFAARLDAYSHWTDAGWRPVRSPLTPEIALAGLQGQGPSISAFMIAPDSVSHVAAIDFDTDDGLNAAIMLAQAMSDESLSAYVEPSRRGAHLWCILDRQVPAINIRRALRALMQTLGWADDPKVELRPGSDTVDARWHEHGSGAVVGDGLGHALRMPLMPHPKTGFRGKMIDTHGNTIGRTVAEVLLHLEQTSADRFLPWAERYQPPPVTAIVPDYRTPHEPFPEDTSTASEILRELWGVPNAAPGRSVRCPAHEDKEPSLSILRDDRRAICKAGYCVLNNSDHGRGTYELRKLAPVATHG